MDNQEIIQVIYSEVKEIRAELQQLRAETADSVSSCRSEVADIKILLIQTLVSHLELLANQETGIEKSAETYVERAYENVQGYQEDKEEEEILPKQEINTPLPIYRPTSAINDSLKELQQLKSSTSKPALSSKSTPSTMTKGKSMVSFSTTEANSFTEIKFAVPASSAAQATPAFSFLSSNPSATASVSTPAFPPTKLKTDTTGLITSQIVPLLPSFSFIPPSYRSPTTTSPIKHDLYEIPFSPPKFASPETTPQRNSKSETTSKVTVVGVTPTTGVYPCSVLFGTSRLRDKTRSALGNLSFRSPAPAVKPTENPNEKKTDTKPRPFAGFSFHRNPVPVATPTENEKPLEAKKTESKTSPFPGFSLLGSGGARNKEDGGKKGDSGMLFSLSGHQAPSARLTTALKKVKILEILKSYQLCNFNLCL